MAEPQHTIDCDVLVIGGGINGAGIARDAAGRGLSVVLCEKDDLAAHTSSASTKLIHGGLRYLEYYEFHLVRKAMIEREVLLRSAPPSATPAPAIPKPTATLRPVDHLGESGEEAVKTNLTVAGCANYRPSKNAGH